MRLSCRQYIQNTLAQQFEGAVRETLAESKVEATVPSVVVDPDDRDGQSLLFWYPTVNAGRDEYIRPAVKIESGAKSALDSHEDLSIIPYVSEEVPQLAIRAEHVTTVVAERTFWDKIIIIHGVRSWFKKRGVLRGEGQRVSRHYYDLHRIFQSELGARAVADRALGVDCVAHARMFFNSPDLGLDHADPGRFSVMPADEMIEDLHRDYSRMAGMIIGDPPEFDDVIASIAALEQELNQ
jgi:hypothetical protein